MILHTDSTHIQGADTYNGYNFKGYSLWSFMGLPMWDSLWTPMEIGTALRLLWDYCGTVKIKIYSCSANSHLTPT